MDYVILFVCVVAGVMFGIIMKLAERAGLSVLGVGVVNYVAAALACAILAAATCGFRVATSTIILGVLAGISYATAYFALIHATRVAGAVIPQIVVRAAIVLPTLFSVIVFHETLYPIQWLGLAILLAAFPFVGMRAIGYQKVPVRKVIPLLAVVVISVGANGSLFKLFAESGASQERTLFFLVVFGVAGIVTAAVLLAKRGKLGAGEVRMGIMLGVTNVLAGFPFVFLLGRMKGALLFPLVSGSGVVMCVVFSWIILRERLSRRSLIGALVASAALFLLKLG